MKDLDTLYEAYQNYKKLCVVDNDTPRFLSAYMANKDRDSEDISTVFSVCHIEQDWVEAIEIGLPFIEKAIKEDRQFIRNDGEVLPIEKVRKTSKASIQDLSKHANYITHAAPEDAATEVLPDKMLVIQKESDFAIYENRVLYAALMYLKDFVASRLVEIKEATNTFLVKQHINKMIDMGSRKIKINLNYDESRVNDPLLTDNNAEKDVIDRLDEVLTNILALLKTPLMREVSKVEMVSRPIAKTNILKMNRNFRESLACFDYIANYQGKGFTIEHIEKSLIPYSKVMNEAYTENLIMLSFLNYIFANNISQQLKDDYDEILQKREIKKQNDVLARLREFHAAADTKEQTINEFLIMFEQGYRILEERNDELNIRIKETETRHAKQLKEVKDTLTQQYLDDKEQLDKEAEEIINAAREDAAKQLTEFKNQFKDHVLAMEQENAAMKAQFEEQQQRIATLEADLLKRRLANGETTAKDFRYEDDFDKLEQLKKDFDAFYDKAWKEAKKQIIKDTLFKKHGKGKNKGAEEEEPLNQEEENKSAVPPVIEPVPVNNEPIKEEPKEEVTEPVPEEKVEQESSEPAWIKPEPQDEPEVVEQSFDEPTEQENEEEDLEQLEQPEEEPLEEVIEEESEPEPVYEEQSYEEPEQPLVEENPEEPNEEINEPEELREEQPLEEAEPEPQPYEEQSEPEVEEEPESFDEPENQVEEDVQPEEEYNEPEESEPEMEMEPEVEEAPVEESEPLEEPELEDEASETIEEEPEIEPEQQVEPQETEEVAPEVEEEPEEESFEQAEEPLEEQQAEENEPQVEEETPVEEQKEEPSSDDDLEIIHNEPVEDEEDNKPQERRFYQPRWMKEALEEEEDADSEESDDK